MAKKRIAITMGDPAGVGPEIIVKAFAQEDIYKICAPLVIGDKAIIKEVINSIGIDFDPDNIEILNLNAIKNPSKLKKGMPSEESGKAAYSYIKKAVELYNLGVIETIVTCPISKWAIKMAGLPWNGHTDMLAELTETENYAMAFYSEALKIVLATIHVPLKDVPYLIKKEKVINSIFFANKACAMLQIENPHIAVCGLNPHAGEEGMLGREEIEEIAPAIKEAKALGINVSGPYPADSIFWRAYNGEFDIVVAMYHDQALAPFKLVAFEKGVNFTMGLPFIRTSPDHGTAYDIAWQGKASPTSLIEAIKLAARMVKE
ncbi:MULTISPECIES: 4-hydroxythreonine-4-phosphate dehydrogenase PdxA [Thermodesulfovibrio]|jgi:4-hydroxythreonine-4-phosphate dehydrogenase|uniref:4-hydroxythreonine-4-phosphate dehydrogenase PdxA n=1 Tax=Thermodesulfovibrio TaxID=28261 RepID=UPI00261EF919|nr:4-hydroxythreonine-4-phosphate dehydrogenase PdxA [Thermodesulfovibrio sp.]